MPYIQVDLDGKRKFPMVARMAGVELGAVTMGLLDLWEHCWREKTAEVPAELLAGFFGCDGERIGRALETFGFATAGAHGTWIIRGAEKRLGILEARSKGGKKARGNLRQFTGSPPAQAGEEFRLPSGSSSGSTPGLTPSIPTPNRSLSSKEISDLFSAQEKRSEQNPPEQQKSHDAETEPVGSPVSEVFEHWRRVMGKNGNAVLTPDRRKVIRARLKEGYSLADLKAAVEGLSKSDWHMGRDPRSQGKRWDDLSYALGNGASVEKYRDLAAGPAPPRRDFAKGRVGAEEIDKSAFEKTGDISDEF